MDALQFPDLLRRHAGLIHKIAFAYCRNATDREDVVQEILVQLWRSHHRCDARGAESTWLYRLALNVAISFYRRERRHRDRQRPLDLHPIAPIPPEPDPQVQQLLRCIDGLGPLDKALVLLYLDAHDHPTIAAVLGISVGNVATKLHRIKARLRVAFAAQAATDKEDDHAR